MVKYQQYDEYKDSEVEWLEKVPSHWQPVPIKYLASEKDTLFLDGDWIESKDISDSGIRYITTGNVGEGQYKEQGTGFISDQVFQKLNCSEVFEQDILISRLNLPIGRACLVPNLNNRIVTSVDNVILRPDIIYCKRFLVHLFSSSEYFHNTANLARGATMQRISRGLLGNIRISLPEKEEQVQIATFLDFETAQIDTLIEKQQTLIQLLKEKRQAVISHAVTKGLNPDSPMKDSGVEWLGEVPEHWEVQRLKYITTHNDEVLSEKTKTEYEIQYVDIGSVSAIDGIVDINKMSFESAPSRARRLVKDGDIIVSTVRTYLKAIAPIISPPINLVVSTGFTVIRPTKGLHKDYASYFLRSNVFIANVVSRSVGVSYPAINSSDLVDIYICKPEYEEQIEISSYLAKQSEKIDDLIVKASHQIELMKERRTALISAAVTGKIDVRGWRAADAN